MTRDEKQQLINEQHNIIHDREARLKATDYIAAKIAEGKATKTEYKPQIEQRQQWRDDINAATALIQELETAEVSPSDEDLSATIDPDPSAAVASPSGEVSL